MLEENEGFLSSSLGENPLLLEGVRPESWSKM